MIEFILSTFAEFGLIHQDYKHQKRISKKEKEDGIKRPFKKYVMQPSVLICISAIVIISIAAILIITFQRTYTFPENTKKEVLKMSERMENWNENLGHYPTDLNELIGNSPARQDWKKDAWNRTYEFKISENGKQFLIRSAGPDGTFNTKDDIISE
ncbi:type II secretion system protein GspG [Formosa algae]|nr:type II secretion system protein GspG [Formosa algae]PNW26427.1 hypothetical protein BKP44_17005 [Formosa algae]